MKAFELERISFVWDASNPFFLDFQTALPIIRNIFTIGKAICSRSTKDVFPFHIEGIAYYYNLQTLLKIIQEMLLRDDGSERVQHPGIRVILRYLHDLEILLAAPVNNPSIISNVMRLESLAAVFDEVRQILAQEDKTETQIRHDVQILLHSIQSLAAWDPTYQTIIKRFQMYDRELYHTYSNPWLPRTNNDQEDFNHTVKRAIRKTMGRKESWFYVEHLGENAAFQQNFSQIPHKVGGTTIDQPEFQCPMERLRIVTSINVSSIMKTIDLDILREAFTRLDSRYAVHKQVCRLFKKGIEACLREPLTNWNHLFLKQPEKKEVVSI
jgi:hypothetical protein